ncbi:MAG TPA: 4-carboxy-4-hydroxy-2-oxoadipate aldolase/oxaloacetate decarboxylase [Anaerovoracaceae bacterium]|nr:4-carboxy-4-hydroxy-2-oxoadipate aldolase/oxaloacetate decarboxylase [Anaerovoracaceae bacterium]
MTLSKIELERFKKLPTGNISDANGKAGNMDYHIKPIDTKSKLVGIAYTVCCHPADNLSIHNAMLEAAPGSVLVVNLNGYSGAGHFGEIMALGCQVKGIAGLVIDGSVRDSQDIEEMGFPVFCRALNPGGTVKETVGLTNIETQCGGIIVKPGDIIVGDRDGVVVVPSEKAYEVLESAEAIATKEVKVKEMLRQGKSTAEIYGFAKLLK